MLLLQNTNLELFVLEVGVVNSLIAISQTNEKSLAGHGVWCKLLDIRVKQSNLFLDSVLSQFRQLSVLIYEPLSRQSTES